MERSTIICRVYALILAYSILFGLLSGCQLSPATSAPATTQPPTTTAPQTTAASPETQPAPEFTLDSMCAIIDDVREFYYNHETFTLPITPYTKWYADRAINRYGAQIECDDQFIRFAKDGIPESVVIYLIFLNTLLTEYGDQVGWVTKGRDVKPDDPMVFYELDTLVFFPEHPKVGYNSIDEYATSWPHEKNDTPYPIFRISLSRISVVAKVDGKSYSCFHVSEKENEPPYYDGTWNEWE